MEQCAESMILKYSIALAFAVLRIKPSEIDGKQFALQLQEQLKNYTQQKKLFNKTNSGDDNNDNIDRNQIQNSKTIEALTQVFDQTFESTSVIGDSQLLSTENNSANPDLVNNFSVLQAINNVKEFLNSGHGETQYWALKRRKLLSQSLESQESGYRTSSQHSRFRDVVEPKQVSESNLSMSATSLTSYIMESSSSRCSTDALLEHAAQLLGQLVDRMHDLGEYPCFVENILDIVGGLLSDVWSCEQGLDVDKKEKLITKLILMNKSIHVQKYSILRLLLYVDQLHEEIMSSDTMYELDNTDRIDVLFYVYYALEHLIAEYVNESEIRKGMSEGESQTTETDEPSQSQQHSSARSSIEDIWRRKWDPNFDTTKETRKRQSKKAEKSVEKECSDVLNKIIIDCMEKYPLISFYALECFNKVMAKNT